MILEPWNGSLLGTDVGLLSRGNRPGWPWYWNLGVKKVKLNYRRALRCSCKLEAIASDTWSPYWLSGTDEMYSQEETDNAVFRGMLSSRSILQVKLKYWITQWSWSLGMVHIWNWFGLLPGGNRPGWPCHWRYGGSSRYKRALLFQLGQSCPDYETLQIKLESVSHVCKIYVIIDTGGQPIYKKGTGLVQLEWMGEQICLLGGTITVWID